MKQLQGGAATFNKKVGLRRPNLLSVIFKGIIMEELGLSLDLLEKELKSKLLKDISFNSGRILGSMCTRPHPLATDIFTRYIEKKYW